MFRGIFNQKRVWLLGIHRGRPKLVIERGGGEGGIRGSLRDKLADATALSGQQLLGVDVVGVVIGSLEGTLNKVMVVLSSPSCGRERLA